MALNNEQRLQLLMQAKMKKVRVKTLAEEVCGCSSSWLSQYFNFKVDISEQMETAIQQYLASK